MQRQCSIMAPKLKFRYKILKKKDLTQSLKLRLKKKRNSIIQDLNIRLSEDGIRPNPILVKKNNLYVNANLIFYQSRFTIRQNKEIIYRTISLKIIFKHDDTSKQHWAYSDSKNMSEWVEFGSVKTFLSWYKLISLLKLKKLKKQLGNH